MLELFFSVIMNLFNIIQFIRTKREDGRGSWSQANGPTILGQDVL